MKKQEFYIFYSKNEVDKVEFRLVKTFTNWFCINEDDQSEIMGFYELNEISETSFASNLREYTNIMLFGKSRKVQLKQIRALLGTARESLKRRASKSDELQIHFIFGLPVGFFTANFVSFISERLIRSSNFNYTVLEGFYREKCSETNSNKRKKRFTIGDDIELMSEQLENFKSNGFYQSKSSSSFLNNDDSFSEIKCQRQSFTTKAILKTVIKIWTFSIPFIIMLVFLALRGLYNLQGGYSIIEFIPILIFFFLLFFVISALLYLFIKALYKIYISSSAIYFMNSHDNDRNKRIKRMVAHIVFAIFLIILVMLFLLFFFRPLFDIVIASLLIILSMAGTAFLLFYIIPLKFFNPPILVPFKFRSNKIRSKIRFFLFVAINVILSSIIFTKFI